MLSLDKAIQDIAENATERLINEKLSRLEQMLAALPVNIAKEMKHSYALDDILNTAEAAGFLGKSQQTLVNWRNNGINLVYHLQNGKVKYLFADVLAFKNALLGKRITPKR